jgi:hypothetical protein
MFALIWKWIMTFYCHERQATAQGEHQGSRSAIDCWPWHSRTRTPHPREVELEWFMPGQKESRLLPVISLHVPPVGELAGETPVWAAQLFILICQGSHWSKCQSWSGIQSLNSLIQVNYFVQTKPEDSLHGMQVEALSLKWYDRSSNKEARTCLCAMVTCKIKWHFSCSDSFGISPWSPELTGPSFAHLREAKIYSFEGELNFGKLSQIIQSHVRDSGPVIKLVDTIWDLKPKGIIVK